MKNEWIYTQKNWPLFTWNYDRIASQLSDIRYRQGIFKGKMEPLGLKVKQAALLTSCTADILKSSAIEGEILPIEEVRSSVARRLGMDAGALPPVGRTTDGIVQAMLDATINYGTPLTAERLFGWHAALFPTGYSGTEKVIVADWRDDSHGPMQVISEKNHKTKIHFQAPPADQIPSEMENFIKWFNADQNLDPVLKAGVAHLWFVTLHPFEDGNGRISRTITDLLLTRAEQGERLYSMSAQIEIERKDYYIQLECQQRGSTDITLWLEWFINCLDRSLATAEATLNDVIRKAKVWNLINEQALNGRQMTVLEKMLGDDFVGFIKTKKYAKIAKCIEKTAQRDIKQLVDKGILIQNSAGGRSVSYRLKE